MVSEMNGDEQKVLSLQDLLVDESNDAFSEYVSISIEPLAEGTKVSVTTVEEQPAIYTAMLTGVTLSDLHCLVDAQIDS